MTTTSVCRRRRCSAGATSSLTILLLLSSWCSMIVVVVDAVRIPRTNRSSGSTGVDEHWESIAAAPAQNSSNDEESSSSLKRGIRDHRHRRRVQVDIPDDADGHLVESMPLLNEDDFPTRHWAGHLPASNDRSKYFFYWLFAPDDGKGNDDFDDDTTIPLIIWLNGGPACSSMDGLWLENGPFRLTKDEDSVYRVEIAEQSWHKAPAYTLYIDQPVGTGLAFTTKHEYPSNDELVNIDFYYFMQSFFKFHADKFVTAQRNTVSRPVYFSGESHAGHYIPSMMNYILKQNDDSGSRGHGKIKIPLAGAAIGNGWVDPYHQYAAAEAAYGHGIIDWAQVVALQEKERECQKALDEGKYSASVCFSLLDSVVSQSHGQNAKYKVSQYDVRFTEPANSARTYPLGHKVVESYLSGVPLKGVDVGTWGEEFTTDQVLDAIHASAATDAGQVYKECTDPPYNALAHQDGKGVVSDVVEVLEHPSKPQLLFFNGIQDLICNHVGNERALERLPWKHAEDWITAKRYAWTADSEIETKISGYVKEFENLMYLKILAAGHMVPMDIPEVSLDMMKVFVYGQSFQDNVQILGRSVPPSVDDDKKDEDEDKEEDDDDEGDQDNEDENDAACGDCPVCPVVNDTSSAQEQLLIEEMARQNDNNNAAASGGVAAISFAWIAALALLALFLAAIAYNGRRRRSSPAAMTSTQIPQYDLELREAHYRDDPPQPSQQNGSNNNGHQTQQAQHANQPVMVSA